MGLLSKIKISDLWNKYGLIVVGNIVFFALLYLFSYRPHNSENRASEFLSMAQLAETKDRQQTAMDLYEKIANDYEGTRACDTALERLPVLRKQLASKPPCPATAPDATKCEAINLEEMLRKGPAVYIATHLARHYDRFPSDRLKIQEIIWKYLKMAHEWGKISVAELKQESEFQPPALQKAFFSLKPKCVLESDFWYDNFYIENKNFFSWVGANLSATVTQGEASESVQLRLDRLKSGEKTELLEFRVRGDGGPVQCRVVLKTEYGDVTVSEEL